MPRNVVYSRWLWQLTKPGMMIAWPKSSSVAPGCVRDERAARPDGDDAPAGHGTAPSGSGGADTGSTQSAR